MNGKKYIVSAFVLNAVLIAFTTCLLQLPRQAQAANDRVAPSLSGPLPKFGPVTEAVLPGAKSHEPEMLDLETGRFVLQEPFQRFKFRAEAIMRWIRSNGLDISCNVWSTGAACVTYDMTVVPVLAKRWEDIAEEELLSNPALTPKHHSPRRLLVLGRNSADTYLFRTGDGTLGILRISGLSQNGQGVKIRYKLINTGKSSS